MCLFNEKLLFNLSGGQLDLLAFRRIHFFAIALSFLSAFGALSAHAQVPLSGIVQVSTGASHACAVTTAGGVKCWGDNQYGQLGVGDTVRYSPVAVDVVGLTTGVVYVSAGATHTCALTTTGGVKCWGNNVVYQLGNNSSQPQYTPVDTVGLATGVSAISANAYQSCALTTSGGVKCWGYNNYAYHPTPIDITGLTTGITAIAAGNAHLCALTSAGGVKCWGDNIVGQLGDGTTSSRSSAVDVSGLSSGVIKIDVSSRHSCALLSDGSVKCWGYNNQGQLGDGTTTQRNTPVAASVLTDSVSSITTSGASTCALTVNGAVKCWGLNASGQLGNNSTLDSLLPVTVFGLDAGQIAVDLGGDYGCSLSSSQQLNCWGDNVYGRLGDGSTLQRLIPSPINAVNTSLPNLCSSFPIAFGFNGTGTWGQSNDCTGGVRGTDFKTDSYSFSGQAGQLISISVSASFNSFVYLRDPSGAVVAYDDDGLPNPISSSSSSSRIPAKWGFFKLLSTGTYTIEVTSASATDPLGQASYNLALTLNGTEPVASSSASSSSAVASSSIASSALSSAVGTSSSSQVSSTASSLGTCAAANVNIGTTYTGTLASGDCTSGARGTGYYTDRYSFSGTAGQQVSIFLSGTFDTYVYLKNPSGVVIASNDDGGGGSNSRIPATSGYFTLPAGVTGNYVIEVTSYSSFATGSYSLTVSINAGASSSSLASSVSSSSVSSTSNSCGLVIGAVTGVSQSGTLSIGDCTTGSRGASYYTDRYSFSGTAGQLVTIQLSSSAFDTYVYLKNPIGSVIASNDDGGGGTNSRIPATSGSFTLPSSGTYVIEVTSYGTLVTGAYSLLLTRQ